VKNTKGLSEVEEHFEKFIKDKRYLANLSELTILSYRLAFRRWVEAVGKEMPNQDNISTYVIGMRERGLSPVTCNISIRSFNSFLSWLAERGGKTLRIKTLKTEKKKMRTFSDAQIRDLLTWKPNKSSKNEARIFVVLRFMLDTGTRINEALTLEMSKVDLDNMLVTVRGKGNKQRTIPISIEMRKSLYTYMEKHRQSIFPSPYVFCTSNGNPWSYQNARRELLKICEKIGVNVNDIDGMFHSFRRKFARNYVRHGGNVMYLMQVMGHSTLQMTKAYVEAEDEDLQDAHYKTSMLDRLRGNYVAKRR
jgi:integrase/recombinase XerD